MGMNYHGKELDLATAVCDKNLLLLQSPGDRFEKRDAERALWGLKGIGDSADKSRAIGDLARRRNATDPTEPGHSVLSAQSAQPTAPGQWRDPSGLVHGTSSDHGHDDPGGYSDEDDGCGEEWLGEPSAAADQWAYYADGNSAGKNWTSVPSA